MRCAAAVGSGVPGCQGCPTWPGCSPQQLRPSWLPSLLRLLLWSLPGAHSSFPPAARPPSQDSLLTDKARAAVLPPLQSVVDLTSAVRPPNRGLDLAAADASAAPDVQQVSAQAEGGPVDGHAETWMRQQKPDGRVCCRCQSHDVASAPAASDCLFVSACFWGQAVSDAVVVSEEEVVQTGALGRKLADGAGRLADGTR